MCQPLEHLSHTNIFVAPPLDPHNIHFKSARIIAKLGSTLGGDMVHNYAHGPSKQHHHDPPT
jgi:hypothetical protein